MQAVFVLVLFVELVHSPEQVSGVRNHFFRFLYQVEVYVRNCDVAFVILQSFELFHSQFRECFLEFAAFGTYLVDAAVVLQ